MALANIAEILFGRGLRVLVVDFDLEAPGLEKFFDGTREGFRADAAMEARGVVDLLYSYMELRTLAASVSFGTETEPPPGETAELRAPASLQSAAVLQSGAGISLEQRIARLPVEPLERFAVPIYSNRSGGSLRIIPAGKRAGGAFREYAHKVLSFDWEDFYRRYDGETFFEWFRQQADESADVVLIDSRTGVTEMSGVCTYHLADVVVSFVAANEQNIQGSLRMGRSLADRDLIEKGRQSRELHQVFVPSRIENAEDDKLKAFASRFNSVFGPLCPSAFTWHDSPFGDLVVPYVPAYAYGERVAVRDRSDQPLWKTMVAALNRLADLMTQLAPVTSPMYQTIASDPSAIAAAADRAFLELDEYRRGPAMRLLLRLVRVGEPGLSPDSIVKVNCSDLPADDELLTKLAGLRLITLNRDEKGSGDSVALADPALLTHWERFKTELGASRAFLAWRQRVAPNLADWRRTRDPDDLLSGQPLSEAEEWSKSRAEDLTPEETEFIRESRRYKQRRESSKSRSLIPWLAAGATLVVVVVLTFWMLLSLPVRQAVLIKVGWWPEPATSRGLFEFRFDGDKWSNRDEWNAPPEWTGPVYLQSDPGILVKGNRIGVPRNAGRYYNFAATFSVQLYQGLRAAWCVRVQPDLESGYRFDLREAPGGVFLEFYRLRQGRQEQTHREHIFDRSCQSGVYTVEVRGVGSRIAHDITCVSDARRFSSVFTYPEGEFPFGSIGFVGFGDSSAVYGFLRVEPDAKIE
jgi:MinD-like ATPase involved in chromosome partitioning or flagellar assembly